MKALIVTLFLTLFGSLVIASLMNAIGRPPGAYEFMLTFFCVYMLFTKKE